MPYPNFPTLPSGAKPDSTKYTVTVKDNTIRQEMEGGYTLTRRRTTRAPRLAWKVQFTYIPNADKAVLESHFNAVGVGASIFNWTAPDNGVIYQVRVRGDVQFNYRGVGTFQRWDCSFELEQA